MTFLPNETVPLLVELSRAGRMGVNLPSCDVPELPLQETIPASELRDLLPLPEISEPEVIRHFTNLSRLNYAIDTGFYPLGSCTMKYNPKLNEQAASHPGYGRIHPYSHHSEIQGALYILHRMQNILSEIAGLDATTLQPAAGAHGELTGIMMIRAYHQDRGDLARNTILVPDSAHGTNPASAARCGFETVSVKSNSRGRVDLVDLRSKLGKNVAGIMLTNPNTVGLFEDNVEEICAAVHACGGLVYCDGANMNALVGRARPGDMGFDVMHFNLHKTFSSPHGGGGPGSGPVSVRECLRPYLPVPMVVETEGKFSWDFDQPKSIGKIHGYYGSFLCIVRAYAFIMYYGKENLHSISDNAVLNANYIRVALQESYDVAFDEICMHECIFTAKRQQREHGVRALDIAKRLMDYGYHPPTIYFPLIVSEALMIEPTETESKETLDAFIDAMRRIAHEAQFEPDLLKSAPQLTPVRKLDEATAARQPCLCWGAGVPGQE